MVGRCWCGAAIGLLVVLAGAGCQSAGDEAALSVTTSSVGEATADAVAGGGDQTNVAGDATSTVPALAITASVGSSSTTGDHETTGSNTSSASNTSSNSETNGTTATSRTFAPGATSSAVGRTTTTRPGSTTFTTTNASNAGQCRAGTTHCVGAGQRYRTLTEAVVAAGNGAVIELLPGRYRETAAVESDNVTIRSQPSNRAVVDCGGMQPARGKACLLAVGTNLTVENLVVTGARGPDNNEACFRNEPGTRFVVRGIECYGSNNGILGSGGSWLIEDSYFHDNGAGDGRSHNLYLSGDCSEVVFKRSLSENAVGGHAFKSRCRTSSIDGSVLNDNTVGDAAEFSNGGNVTIRNSTVSQPDGANGNMIRHGAEGCTHAGRLTIIGSTIQSARTPSYIRSACGPVTVTDTVLPSGVEVVDGS